MNNDKEDRLISLNEKHKILLSRYFDDESSWFESWRVERLLRDNPQAGAYLESLQTLREDVAKALEPAPTIDLWDKISARIINEERNSIYSRKASRESKERNKSLLETAYRWIGSRFLTGRSSIGIGFGTGALTAALLILIVMPQARPVNNAKPLLANNTQDQSLAERSGDIRNNNMGGTSSKLDTIRYLPQDIQGTDFDLSPEASRFGTSTTGIHAVSSTQRKVQPMELDWVRSDGTLRVMRDSHESNPVIFVAPRSRSGLRSGSVINGGVQSGYRGGVLSRRSTRSGLAPFDDTFAVSSSSFSSAPFNSLVR